MTIHQISVFLENRAGQLAEITRILADAGIDDDDTESDDESELPAQEAQDGASSVVEPATGESDADQPQDDSTEPASDED